MPPGEFVVGRSSSCHLALDDALVSRRHATIHVQAGGAEVEDLGSRNGVSVNGERIQGRRKLANLDRVTIGSHELVVVEIPDRPTIALACEVCATPLQPDMAFCQRCGHPTSKGGSPTLVGMTLEMPAQRPDALKTAKFIAMTPHQGASSTAPPIASEDEHTGRALLTGIADKAFALGRFDEAERVLGKSLKEMLERAKSKGGLSDARVVEGTKYAIKLAEGTRRTSWLDWVFDIHAETARLMSADEIERMHEIVRKLRYRGVGSVRRYLDAIRARGSELTPSERFLLSRLEGIERIVSA